jgi:small subunit ribosomal protein S6
MDKSHRLYESTFIINASLDDAQVDAVITRVQDVIAKNGGGVTALNKWGRKRLAYPINKKTNGFYVNLEFSAPGPLLAALERAYQLDEMVLRYLTIVLDKKAVASREKALAAAAAAAAAAAPDAPAPAVPAREPLFKEGTGEKKS